MTQVPPGAPSPDSDMLVPASLVFKPSKHPISLKNSHAWWKWKPGANLKHPLGLGSSIEGKEDHPVAHISRFDAIAYAEWAGKRLHTKDILYVWGNAEFSEENFQTNRWQGFFPYKSTKSDGNFGTTPVKSYQPNPYGLYDMAGNV